MTDDKRAQVAELRGRCERMWSAVQMYEIACKGGEPCAHIVDAATAIANACERRYDRVKKSA